MYWVMYTKLHKLVYISVDDNQLRVHINSGKFNQKNVQKR